MAEHVLMCFRSWDLQVTLELVVQGPTEETEDAAQVSESLGSQGLRKN
jgi:hypothetical protein